MERVRVGHKLSRLTVSGVVAAAALAILVAANANAAQRRSLQAVTQKNWFTYGMTHKQGIRIIGRPKSIRGSYWYYPLVHGLIAGKVRVVVYNTNILQPANQFRMFWYAGQLQGEEVHVRVPVNGYIWRGIIL